MSAWEIGSELEDLGQDLLRLEVNTIIKPTITGTRMPPAHHAVLDIVRDYERWILERTTDENRMALQTNLREKDTTIRIAGIVPLEDLREAAKQLAQETRLSQPERSMAGRIVDNCAALVGILRRNKISKDASWTRETSPPLLLSIAPAETRILRKIWDISTEQIACQTIIHIDGDVTTRIAADFSGEAQRFLYDLHQQGLSSALSYWRGLAEIGIQILRCLASSLARLVR